MDEVWSYEHSVECPVRAEFAWRFWTDVRNWAMDADVESVKLDGPFASGSRGATITRSRVHPESVRTDGTRIRVNACLDRRMPPKDGRLHTSLHELCRFAVAVRQNQFAPVRKA